jgi:hypothetical protein
MSEFNRSIGRQFGVSGRQDDRQFWIFLFDSLRKPDIATDTPRVLPCLVRAVAAA